MKPSSLWIPVLFGTLVLSSLVGSSWLVAPHAAEAQIRAYGPDAYDTGPYGADPYGDLYDGRGPLPEANLRVVRARRCIRGTLGQVYCAENERGVAIEDALGTVRCAAGACLEVEVAEATAWDSQWVCASAPGGEVRLAPQGPVCDGGCTAPRSTRCQSY